MEIKSDGADIVGNDALVISSQEGAAYTHLNGADESVIVSTGVALAFERTDAFSISAWVLRNVGGDTHMIFGKQHSSNGVGYVFFLDPSDRLGVLLGNGTKRIIVYSNNNDIFTGVWTHVAFTYDGSTNAIGCNLYINGGVTAHNIADDDCTLSIVNVTVAAYIGRRTLGNPFAGDIDEVAVFERELSAAEVLNIYNKGRIGVSYAMIPNLVSHWKMDMLNPIDETGANNGVSLNQDVSNIVTEATDVDGNEGFSIEVI